MMFAQWVHVVTGGTDGWVPWYVNLMMSWLPFLVLIGTGIYVARSFG